MPPPPRVSIVTPCYNHAPFVREAIDSVLGQQGAFELEYVVMDGGSTDGTVDILRSYGERLRFTSGRDGGQVDAINRGLRAASGDVLGWLNSDDVLCPGALERVVGALARRPDAEWVHGRCRIVDERGRETRRWISRYKDWRARRHSFDRLVTENYVSQMTTFWRRSAWERVGPLDERLKLAFDYDLWLRLARLSAPVYLRGEPLACFRWYEASKSGAQFRAQFREDLQVARRHAPGRTWLLARKRAKTAAFLAVYEAMAVLRRATRAARA